MSNVFEQPEYLGKEALLDALERDDVPALGPMIVAAALYEEDFEFVQRACVRLSAHADEIVRGNATLCFGHLARLFGNAGTDAAAIVSRALTDSSRYVRGQAHSAASDLEHFLGTNVRE